MPSTKSAPLHHQKMGGSGPNIVFLNGFRMAFETWDKVYPSFTSHHSPLVFNRRGVGKSLKATEPQDGEQIIAEMRALFAHVEMTGPFVLVAHSLGGLLANLYARMYPDEVAGVVFVDATHPAEIAEQKANSTTSILSVLNNGLKSIEKLFDAFKYSEDECLEHTLRQVNAAGPFPNIPITVLTGTQKMPFISAADNHRHQEFQKDLLNLSSNSKHYFCENSSHFPQITEPEKVIDAITYILDEAK